jgi:hypothetical protein
MGPTIGLVQKLRGRAAQSFVEYALTLAFVSTIAVLEFGTIRLWVITKLNVINALISQLQ